MSKLTASQKLLRCSARAAYWQGCWDCFTKQTGRRTAAQLRLRWQVADLIGADPKEIIFTSGATESNNMSIKGVANFYKDRKRHIITTQTERASRFLVHCLLYLPKQRVLEGRTPNGVIGVASPGCLCSTRAGLQQDGKRGCLASASEPAAR